MNPFVHLLLVLFAQAPAPAASRPGQTIITLRKEAVVRGAEVLLGDIADITGPMAADYSKLQIGYAPAPGVERRVAVDAVQVKLTAGGAQGNSYKIVGASSVIRGETQVVSGADLAARTVTELTKRLSENARVEVRTPPGDFKFAAPRERGANASIEFIVPTTPLKGDFNIEARATHGGETLGAVRIPVRVRIEVEALVVVQAIQSGDSIDATKIVRRRVDVTFIEGEPVQSTASLNGRIAARPLAKEKILTIQDLAVAPVFRRGDQAHIIIQRGSLRIDAVVRVDADALPGSRVPVTCLEFGKSLVAFVRDDGTLVLPGENNP